MLVFKYVLYYAYHLPLRVLLLPEGGEFPAASKLGCSASLPMANNVPFCSKKEGGLFLPPLYSD